VVFFFVVSRVCVPIVCLVWSIFLCPWVSGLLLQFVPVLLRVHCTWGRSFTVLSVQASFLSLDYYYMYQYFCSFESV